MDRVISYLSAAIIAFIVGLAAHSGVDTLGGFAVDKVYDDAAVDVNNSTILHGAGSTALPVYSCTLVVSVTADGALILNAMSTGTLNDSSALTATLRTLFERREELHVYVSSELSSRVPEPRQIEKTVYIQSSAQHELRQSRGSDCSNKGGRSRSRRINSDRPSPKP